MRWGLWIGFAVWAAIIFAYEWPRMKAKPVRDKLVFLTLLVAALLLSTLDLLHTPGPRLLLTTIFEPFAGLLELQKW